AAAVAASCGGGGGHNHGPPFDVTGAISAAAGSAIDSDTNDPIARYQRNDSAAEAQVIGNPVLLGGHVNRPRSGPPGVPEGRTTAAGDVSDWFRVSLAHGQTIRLQIAENGTTNDLDLELRRLDQTLVESSATKSRTEEIQVDATGDYYVVVVASSGFSN